MEKIFFEDLPSTNTPINSANLNQMQDNMESAINGIVESGINGNGSWMKFSDGTMICRNTVRLTGISTVVPSNGAIPISENQEAIPFPAEFIESPQVEMSACRHNSWIGYNWRPTTTATAQFAIYTNIPLSDFYIDIQYIAIGKWK